MPPPTRPVMGAPVPLRVQALRLAVEVGGSDALGVLPTGALHAIEQLLADAQEGYLSMDDVRCIVRTLTRP